MLKTRCPLSAEHGASFIGIPRIAPDFYEIHKKDQQRLWEMTVAKVEFSEYNLIKLSFKR